MLELAPPVTARKMFGCESENESSKEETGAEAPACLKSSVMLCRLTSGKRDLTAQQPSLAFLDDLPGYKAASQHQSRFFQLCQELRDEIYSLILRSRSSDRFAESAACECMACNARRRLPVGTTISPGSSSPIHRNTRSTAIDLFRVCRRIYDEARPILSQVNSLHIDGKGNTQHYLGDLSQALCTHRGIADPASFPGSILIPINLVFSFAIHDASISSTSPSEPQVLKSFATTLHQLHPLHFQTLSITILQSRHIQIADYIPLLRALSNLPPVTLGCVTIDLSRTHPTTAADRDVLAAVATHLTTALHAPPPLDQRTSVISAFDTFRAARARVQKAAENGEECYYTTKPELERLRNFLLDADADEGGYGYGYGYVAVSYTHLTLPTKRIV